MEWRCERSSLVVTKVRSMYRQFRLLKAEKQLQRVEWVASGKIHENTFKNNEHVDVFLAR